MTKVHKGYYLFVTPYVALAHLHRPGIIRRFIQWFLFAWKWIPQPKKCKHSVIVNHPDTAEEYTILESIKYPPICK